MKAEELNLVGCDPSLRNWGLARARYNLLTRSLLITELASIHPVIPTGKQVRQNSKDLECAVQLYRMALQFAKGADAVFVEVPVGSKSARAMASYGICVGVLGAMRASGVPFFELTPTEVKVAAVGDKTASKRQMIDWASKAHPEANWPTVSQKGKTSINESKAEHMADAVGAIHAGINNNQFQQLLAYRVA